MLQASCLKSRREQMQVDPVVVERYRKVDRLARDGAPGERDVAAKKAAKMAADHPGLVEAARAAEQREKAEEAVKGMGFDPSSFAAGFDDTEWFDAINQFYEASRGERPNGGASGIVEELWWSAIRWAADSLHASEAPQEPPENARKRNPIPKKHRQSERTVARRIVEDVEIEEAFEGRDEDTDEALITVSFTLPADLWDHVVGSRKASTELIKHLDRFVEDYDEDAEDDDTDSGEDED